MTAIDDPIREVQAPSIELGDLLEHALRDAKDWQNLAGDGFSGLSSDAEFELRMRTRALVAEHEAIINHTDPGRIADADAALRERLVAEAEQAYWDLFQGANAVAERVAELLGLRTPHEFAGLPVVAPRQLVDGLAPPRPERTGAPLPARILKVFRPSWSGITMAVIATKLLGVQLPAGVLIGLAILAAILLGGAAYTGERKRALDRRRSDAVAAQRATVEDFRLTLTKQLRDASRSLQRDLRRASAAAAATRITQLTIEIKMVRGTRR